MAGTCQQYELVRFWSSDDGKHGEDPYLSRSMESEKQKKTAGRMSRPAAGIALLKPTLLAQVGETLVLYRFLYCLPYYRAERGGSPAIDGRRVVYGSY